MRNARSTEELETDTDVQKNYREKFIMDTTTLIILVIVLVLLFGGGGGYYWRRRR
jgi:LPXTG-motif cell wall-anchored protein